MSKYRLIQLISHNKEGEYKEVYRIQKRYGLFDWIDLIDEEYKTKNEGLNRLEEIQKDKIIKYLFKVIRIIK
jgi:hypothetical protein